MLEEIKYLKPPIVEVVCEFRFVPGSPWDAAIPGLVYAQLSSDFPKRRMLRGFEGLLSTAEGGIQQQIQLAERVQFLREDEKASVQVGADFLAVNHLAPYPTWEDFRPIIRQGFNAYREVAKPAGLRRIGLRYINQVELTGEQIALKDYFNFYPHTGSVIPAIAEFVLGVVSPFEQNRDALRLQMNSAEPGAQGRLAVFLDLDYFLTQSQAVSIDATLDWVEVAHNHILETFEAGLTDSLRAMFGPQGK